MKNRGSILMKKEDIIGDYCKVLKENYALLEKEDFRIFKEAFNESVNLGLEIIDFIDYLRKKYGEDKALNVIPRSAFLANVHTIVHSLALGLWRDILSNDLPSCAFKLRVILEISVKSFLLDYFIAEVRDEKEREKLVNAFFADKLDLLEKIRYEKRERRGKRLTTSGFFREGLKKAINESFADKVVKLWGELSDWMHITKYVKRALDMGKEAEKGFPAYLIIPMLPFDKSDEKDFKEIAENTKDIKDILQTLIKEWKNLEPIWFRSHV